MMIITFFFNLLFTKLLNKTLSAPIAYLQGMKVKNLDIESAEAISLGYKALKTAPTYYEIESFAGLYDVIYDYFAVNRGYKALKKAVLDDDRDMILERLCEIYDYADDLRFAGI